MASSPSQGERECVGSVQSGQTLLLHARSPSPSALPILSCMSLHHFPSTFGAESSQFPETSLSSTALFACVAPCLVQKEDKQIWMVGNDKWLEAPWFSDLGHTGVKPKVKPWSTIPELGSRCSGHVHPQSITLFNLGENGGSVN